MWGLIVLSHESDLKIESKANSSLKYHTWRDEAAGRGGKTRASAWVNVSLEDGNYLQQDSYRKSILREASHNSTFITNRVTVSTTESRSESYHTRQCIKAGLCKDIYIITQRHRLQQKYSRSDRSANEICTKTNTFFFHHHKSTNVSKKSRRLIGFWYHKQHEKVVWEAFYPDVDKPSLRTILWNKNSSN